MIYNLLKSFSLNSMNNIIVEVNRECIFPCFPGIDLELSFISSLAHWTANQDLHKAPVLV